jgi:hypothetical protein
VRMHRPSNAARVLPRAARMAARLLDAILLACCSCSYLAERMGDAMRLGQPGAQLAGRRVRRRTIERHHGRRNARRAHDLGAPAVAGDRRHLDPINAPADGLVEALNRLGCSRSSGQYRAPQERGAKSEHSLAAGATRQAKGATKGASTGGIRAKCTRLRVIFFARDGFSTGDARVFHTISTAPL